MTKPAIRRSRKKEQSLGARYLDALSRIARLEQNMQCGCDPQEYIRLHESQHKEALEQRDEARAKVAQLEQRNAELEKVKDQVDDVLIVDWVSVKDGNYRQALADLVSWNIKIHDDPAVSEVAAKRAKYIADLEASETALLEACKGVYSRHYHTFGSKLLDRDEAARMRLAIQAAESRRKRAEGGR